MVMNEEVHIVHNEQETERIAQVFAQSIVAGDIIWFIGDVGAGKTSFIRSLVHFFSPQADVSSPTFTLEQQYMSDQFIFYHYDFYRLADIGLARHEIEEKVAESNAVLLIEWPEISTEFLDATKTIVFERMREGESWRRITIKHK